MRNTPLQRAGLAAAAALTLAARPEFGADQPATPMQDNPFFTESTLPFHLPPFDRIKDSDYEPAFERGMADELKEVDAIASNPDKPTFDNTIVALERAGRLRGRVERVFDNLKGANTDDEIDRIDSEMSPRLSATDDAVYMNPALFARVQAVYDQRASLGLDDESLRLVEFYYRDFVRAGARLSDADKARMKDMNAEIASLQTKFGQNVLKEKNADSIVVRDRAELAGLSDAEIAGLAETAKAEGMPGAYVIRLVNTTGQGPLSSLRNRALRQRIMEASLARGIHGGAFDNQSTVVGLAKLRAERAVLLGYEDHAGYQGEIGTARTVAAGDNLRGQL